MFTSLNNIFARAGRRLKRRKGFTFFEVMVTVAILSTGIVMIYRAFLSAVGFQQHLSTRITAQNLVENKLAELQQEYYVTNDEPRDFGNELIRVWINNRPVVFFMGCNLTLLDENMDIYLAEVSLTWQESVRQPRISRSAYLSLL